MCRIKGCYGKSVAGGLCAKHLMRVRRTGDPHKVRKRGPKPSSWQAGFREMFPEYSKRTQARQIRAFRLLNACGEGAFKEAVKAATRPNDSVNVSKLLEIAERMYAEQED
jgi:hypothetical protein